MSLQDIDSDMDPPVLATGGPRRKSRVVMWASITTAVVLAALIAILASSKQSNVTASSPLIGRPAPAISGNGINRPGTYSLAGFSGQWVLVNFAASWCPPCRAETPQLQVFQSEHSAKGDATILAVEDDPGDSASLKSFLTQNKATWPAVQDNAAPVAYGVGTLPQSFLVDPQGTVIAKYDGEVTAAGLDKVISEVNTAG